MYSKSSKSKIEHSCNINSFSRTLKILRDNKDLRITYLELKGPCEII